MKQPPGREAWGPWQRSPANPIVTSWRRTGRSCC